ncbi:uncharacterized protein VTP21DRAFT_10893 [Calcarisporiella thermophila]|uniref:uncharacterized protein n=1 Tax=Calcarisporiella thermophila TaxID=911321 RepID=UPI00374201C3
MSNVRMLKEDEEVEVEVSWEDQKNINTFSKLNAKIDDLEDEYQKKKQEKEYLDDLSTELELADEDEPVKYRVGDAFVHLSLSQAQERIEQEQASLDQQIEALGREIENVRGRMTELKTVLYGKFKNAINLEKD